MSNKKQSIRPGAALDAVIAAIGAHPDFSDYRCYGGSAGHAWISALVKQGIVEVK